jgi:hypothetical protein
VIEPAATPDEPALAHDAQDLLAVDAGAELRTTSAQTMPSVGLAGCGDLDDRGLCLARRTLASCLGRYFFISLDATSSC